MRMRRKKRDLLKKKWNKKGNCKLKMTASESFSLRSGWAEFRKNEKIDFSVPICRQFSVAR
jgi:hypothetical protein